MREVTIATVQMKPQLHEMEDNLIKMSEYIKTICGQQKVDVIVFPELITSGYECGVRFTDLAQRIPGPTVNLISQRASDYGVYVAFGLPSKEKVESIIFNSMVLVGPDGEMVGEYRKVHLKGEEHMAFRRGLRFPVFETNFGLVGLLSGYDLAFPEAARCLAMEGAELVLTCANWETGLEDEFDAYLQSRSVENAFFMATANRVGEDVTQSFCGHSAITGPRGEIYASMKGELDPETGGPAEGYAIARVDLSDVRRKREEFQTFQNRQPDIYRQIVKKY